MEAGGRRSADDVTGEKDRTHCSAVTAGVGDKDSLSLRPNSQDVKILSSYAGVRLIGYINIGQNTGTSKS